MFIRYFARTDESDVGRAAADYCDALVATGIPVRLVSTKLAELQLDGRGRTSSIWDRHRGLLTTPMAGDYANVVCGDPADWMRFYTGGVKNVLLFCEHNLKRATPELAAAASRYTICVPNEELATALEPFIARRPDVVPLGTAGALPALLHVLGAMP